MEKLVWYACYGSNLSTDRFLKYILGGTPELATHSQKGCSDKTLPRKSGPILIRHQLYFALEFAGWGNKGVCFLKQNADPEISTFGKKYLISESQFREVVYQENQIHEEKDHFDIDLIKTQNDEYSIIPSKYYDRLMFLGIDEGFPIFTFTANWDEKNLTFNDPSPEYLKTIILGIRETFNVSDEEIKMYLSEIPGIKNKMNNMNLEKAFEK